MQRDHRQLHPEIIAALPCPGDLIKAQKYMRAWENVNRRGTEGPWIHDGEVVTVNNIWAENNQCRIFVWFQGSLALFSCRLIDVPKNWRTVRGRPMTVSPDALSRMIRGCIYRDQVGPSGDTREPEIRRSRVWPVDQVGTGL